MCTDKQYDGFFIEMGLQLIDTWLQTDQSK